jgi:hypothetical protein
VFEGGKCWNIRFVFLKELIMSVDNFIKNLIKVTENDIASVVSSGIVGDCSTFVDTGSFALNALLSGSLYGGVPSNKITCFAGTESVGKTSYFI